MAPIQLPADMRSLLAFRPETASSITALAQILLHAPNSLTRGERELIAARVSTLNDCTFCRASHAAIAACHLGDEGLVASVVRYPDTADIAPKLKALLEIAARVQQGGRAVRNEDVDRARREGATDMEIHDTVLIAALFCLCNRYVDGLAAWTPEDPAFYRQRAALVAEHGYADPVATPPPDSTSPRS
ncbi:MAG: carboxymuconolactone decarboxylase family protein [Vicinamibacterales bacterium]